jgi:hypothetical protein
MDYIKKLKSNTKQLVAIYTIVKYIKEDPITRLRIKKSPNGKFILDFEDFFRWILEPGKWTTSNPSEKNYTSVALLLIAMYPEIEYIDILEYNNGERLHYVRHDKMKRYNLVDDYWNFLIKLRIPELGIE